MDASGTRVVPCQPRREQVKVINERISTAAVPPSESSNKLTKIWSSPTKYRLNHMSRRNIRIRKGQIRQPKKNVVLSTLQTAY